MSKDKNIEDMFEVKGVDGFDGFKDYEEFDNDEDSDEPEIIVLTDEDGVDHSFAVLDVFDYEQELYMVIADPEEDENEAHEVKVLRAIPDSEDPEEGEMTLEEIDDDLTIRTIFAIFRARHEDEFEYADEEDE